MVASEVDFVDIREIASTVCVVVVPVVIEVGCGFFNFFRLTQSGDDHGVERLGTAVDGCLACEQVLCVCGMGCQG